MDKEIKERHEYVVPEISVVDLDMQMVLCGSGECEGPECEFGLSSFPKDHPA